MNSPTVSNPAFAAPDSSSQNPSQTQMNRVVILLTLSVLINYLDRSNLSIAAPLLKTELNISNTQVGTLLSAFFWTYALMQLPAGWLVDRFDVKWVFAAGYFVWSIATAATGVLHGFASLLVIRVILGLGESVAFPSCSKILGTHFREERRGFANALIIAGLALGPAVGLFVGGHAVDRYGWRPFFVVLGLIGLVWLAPWVAWMPRRTTAVRPPAFPWSGLLPILRQRSSWGTCIGQACVNYSLYFLVTWLPSYLISGRHLGMKVMAWQGGLLFLTYAATAAVCGKLSDRWINAGASTTLVRKGTMGAGCVGLGIAFAVTAVVPDPLLPLMMVITGMMAGICACATWAIPQTLAGPEMVGRWTGLQNFAGNIGGGIAPALTGYLLDRTGHFLWPFAVTACVTWIGALAWTFIVGPIEQVQWDHTHR